MEYLHSADWIVGDLRASNIQLTYTPRHQTATAMLAAAGSAGSRAVSFSCSAPSGCSPRLPAGLTWQQHHQQQQQQQGYQGFGLIRGGSLPCSPQAAAWPAVHSAGSFGCAQPQPQQRRQQQAVSRDDSAGAVMMRLVPKVADLGLGRCALCVWGGGAGGAALG
jgi:hypothetical protein